MLVAKSPGVVQADPGDALSARERILQAADRLFYAEGLQAVGMQRLVTEAQVTLVTMYRHFPSKDDLVSAYLHERAIRGRARVAELIDTPDPRLALRALMQATVTEQLLDEYRGCPFINAAAEFGTTGAAVRAAAADQRAWINRVTEGLLRAAGHPNPAAAARVLLMLRTGAVVANSLDGPLDCQAEFLAVCEHIADGG